MVDCFMSIAGTFLVGNGLVAARHLLFMVSLSLQLTLHRSVRIFKSFVPRSLSVCVCVLCVTWCRLVVLVEWFMLVLFSCVYS